MAKIKMKSLYGIRTANCECFGVLSHLITKIRATFAKAELLTFFGATFEEIYASFGFPYSRLLAGVATQLLGTSHTIGGNHNI